MRLSDGAAEVTARGGWCPRPSRSWLCGAPPAWSTPPNRFGLVEGQTVHTARLDSGAHTASWTEPTGTSVALVVDLEHRRLHGVIFFPRWVWDDPAKTAFFQNDHLDRMTAFRDAGPTHPVEVVDEMARITFADQRDTGDDTVIDRAPGDLPDGYADRTR